jgi:hypothetical protein
VLSFPEAEGPQKAEDGGSLWAGFGLAALINVGAVAAGALTLMVGIGFVILLGLGVVQLLWIIPLYSKYNRQGKTQTALGVLLAAGITFLLQAGCYGLVLLNVGRLH